jgi:5'-deoxynucleotidase YfbR-like HD superfamily hydrolase
MNMLNVIAVNVARGPTITLASGGLFDFLDPHGSDFTIEDIAHGLAHVCRYAGQCRGFFSVAEHSIMVSDTVAEFAYEALLHDAAEAFIGDVTRPLKQLLPEFKRIEANVEDAIIKRFGMDPRFRKAVKKADLRVLAAEQIQVMAPGCADWAIAARIEPAPIVVRHLDPPTAKREFLDRYKRYVGQRRTTTRCSSGSLSSLHSQERPSG